MKNYCICCKNKCNCKPYIFCCEFDDICNCKSICCILTTILILYLFLFELLDIIFIVKQHL